MPARRWRLPDYRDIVLAISVLVFLSSVSALVVRGVATGHELPGFALYGDNAVTLQRNASVSVLPPEVTAEVDLAEPLAAPVVSLSLPSISIVAPLVPMGVRPDGYMDLPNSPHDVAWYQFTSKPGMGGNAVFSAHVDYINYGPAVFWNLNKVEVGDPILVRLRDGSLITYKVSETKTVPIEDLDVGQMIAPTDPESITLITCTGEFSLGNYSHRVVVHAVRTGAQRGTPASARS